jgi:hypothetical protein
MSLALEAMSLISTAPCLRSEIKQEKNGQWKIIIFVYLCEDGQSMILYNHEIKESTLLDDNQTAHIPTSSN